MPEPGRPESERPEPGRPEPERRGAGGALGLDRACELARTGDLWVFRGRSGADRIIRGLTNAPVNHVGMAVVVDDLPPMLFHAELGRSLLDLWTGTHQRGVQLHDMRDAVLQWGHRYGQRAWLRQLDGPVGRAEEDGALRAVARLDGTPFPSTARLAGRWLWGRVPSLPAGRGGTALPAGVGGTALPAGRGGTALPAGRGGTALPRRRTARGDATLETAYCAEVVALAYQEMGLLPSDRRPSWYDPGRFWSGDDLELAAGFALGAEIGVALPPRLGTVPAPVETGSWRARWNPRRPFTRRKVPRP